MFSPFRKRTAYYSVSYREGTPFVTTYKYKRRIQENQSSAIVFECINEYGDCFSEVKYREIVSPCEQLMTLKGMLHTIQLHDSSNRNTASSTVSPQLEIEQHNDDNQLDLKSIAMSDSSSLNSTEPLDVLITNDIEADKLDLLFQNAENVHKITLYYCTHAINSVIASLHIFPNLRSMCIFGDYPQETEVDLSRFPTNITTLVINECSLKSQLHKDTKACLIDISGCSLVSDHFRMPSCTHSLICNCIDIATIRMLDLKESLSLRHLSFTWCRLDTLSFLKGLSLPKLNHLDIRHNKITHSVIVDFMQHYPGINIDARGNTLSASEYESIIL